MIGDTGRTIFDDVRQLDDAINRLPQTRGWSGPAQEAANGMFGRAVTRASKFLDYTQAVSKALDDGAARIGRARTDLLREADAIDRSELSVGDTWVVQIRPAAMTAEHAAELQTKAQAAQNSINDLLTRAGRADDETTQALLVARASKGAEFDVHRMGPPGPVPPVPGDEVPNPSTEAGRKLQELVRDQDMATSVRETTESTDENGNQFKTLYMVDGSKQVIKEEGGWPPSAHVLPEGTLQVTQYDKDGNEVSIAETIHGEDGTETTNVWWTDGTSVVMTRTPDGKCSGAVTTADGRHGTLADEFFEDPVPDVVGGSMTALEKQAEKGIPTLSARALENVSTGARIVGPAYGVVASLYDVSTAETKHDACVAAWKGGMGLAGGVAVDAALTAFQPELGPVWAGLASGTGGFGFGKLGGFVGELVCPK
ncbi:hypothetical protein [Mycobacterium sp. NPDC006124]|uniref:hypothetical protein n=1 Tax=Mycobacterium sp. NPDC006124 TaxID=3156729 RepID=UPI0033BBED24